MGVVSLGLFAAIIFGASDFLGGFATRALPALHVTLTAFLSGLVVALVLLPVAGSAWTADVLVYGVIAGAGAAVSIWLLYACLAIGPVSVLAPMVAVIAAVVPVAYGLSHHERLGTPGKIALGVVFVSAVLVGYTPADRGVRVQPRALLLGVAAGLATGGYLVALDYTPRDSGAAPIVVVYVSGAALLTLAVAAVRRRHPAGTRGNGAGARGLARRWSAPLGYAMLSGATQAVADVLVVVGIHWGDLAVMAALMALYPLGTIALACVVIRERPTSLQFAGILLAVAASAALSVT